VFEQLEGGKNLKVAITQIKRALIELNTNKSE
jgi:hypothetical protein